MSLENPIVKTARPEDSTNASEQERVRPGERLARIEAVAQTLNSLLPQYNIKPSLWGKDGAKTLRDLAEEIVDGETVLLVENGEIVRLVTVARVDVIYDDGKRTLRLLETKQVFHNGTVRERGLWGVNEKAFGGEEPVGAALRGLREEIGAKEEDLHSLTLTGQSEELSRSRSYPGIETKYRNFHFQAVVTRGFFNPDGYVEEEERATTYFGWQELPPEEAWRG